MAKKEIPWIDWKAQSQQACEPEQRPEWKIRMAWAMCVFLIIGGIVTPYRLTIVFGVLYILVLLMDKQVAATPRGLEIFYDMKVTTNYTIWPWEEIVAISREENDKYPDIYAIYFTRGDKSKRVFFRKSQWDEVIRLAKQGNHGLQVAR